MTITGPELVFYIFTGCFMSVIIVWLLLKLGKAHSKIEKLERLYSESRDDYWRKDIQVTELKDTMKTNARRDYKDGYKAGYNKGLEDGTNVWDTLK